MTVDEMVEYFSRFTNLDVSRGVIDRYLEKAEKERIEFSDKAITEVRENEELPGGCDVVSFGMDGVNMLIREEGGKKGRPQERPKLNDDSNKVKKASYQNAMCGTVSFYCQGDEKYERVSSHYVGQMPQKGFPDFRESFEAEVKSVLGNIEESGRNFYKIVLCDGARPLWKYVEASDYFKGCYFLVDYYHVTEHLSKAVEVIWGKSSKEGKIVYRRWLKVLKKKSGAYRVIQSLRYYCKGLTKKKKTLVAQEIAYLQNNASKMDYHFFVERGFPIGSGVTEAACKSIVKQRMCRSGMRWNKNGGTGQLILTMRSIIKSGRWDHYWQEFQDIKMVA